MRTSWMFSHYTDKTQFIITDSLYIDNLYSPIVGSSKRNKPLN